MNEVCDGEFMKYAVEPGSYIREHFFGKYPETRRLVEHLSDEQLRKLSRGGHDPEKVYAAYAAAVAHRARSEPKKRRRPPSRTVFRIDSSNTAGASSFWTACWTAPASCAPPAAAPG